MEMNGNTQKSTAEKLGYLLGRIFAAALMISLGGCTIAVLIALTYKVIMWIF